MGVGGIFNLWFCIVSTRTVVPVRTDWLYVLFSSRVGNHIVMHSVSAHVLCDDNVGLYCRRYVNRSIYLGSVNGAISMLIINNTSVNLSVNMNNSFRQHWAQLISRVSPTKQARRHLFPVLFLLQTRTVCVYQTNISYIRRSNASNTTIKK